MPEYVWNFKFWLCLPGGLPGALKWVGGRPYLNFSHAAREQWNVRAVEQETALRENRNISLSPKISRFREYSLVFLSYSQDASMLGHCPTISGIFRIFCVLFLLWRRFPIDRGETVVPLYKCPKGESFGRVLSESARNFFWA
jgi:hypothetical protein